MSDSDSEYRLVIRLHKPKLTPAGKNPRLPAWQLICNAITEAFDLIRQNKTDRLVYTGKDHTLTLVSERLIQEAEEREIRELSKALTAGAARGGDS